MPTYSLMCFSPSLCLAVAKFVASYASLSSQNDSIILTRLFFPPRERSQRKCRWPRPVNHRLTAGRLGHCHPRNHPLHQLLASSTLLLHAMTASSPAPAYASNWVLPPHRCKQSSVWPSSGVDLIFHSPAVRVCVCPCEARLGLAWPTAERSVFASHTHSSARVVLCYFFLIGLQHGSGTDQLKSLGLDMELKYSLHAAGEISNLSLQVMQYIEPEFVSLLTTFTGCDSKWKTQQLQESRCWILQ